MNISTPELLAYSNILDNMFNTTLQISSEMSRAVQDGICTKEELEPIYQRMMKANAETFDKHEEVTKELDLRMKRDLGIKQGIRKVQSTIREFDTFVKNKQQENSHVASQDISDAARISLETIANQVKTEESIAPMKVVKGKAKTIKDTDSD